MSVYGVMADLHAHNWRTFSTTNADGVNSRLRHILNEIERCAKAVSGRGGRSIYIAGDVFHERGSIKPSVLNPVRETLQKCHDTYGVIFSIVPGNHDLESKETNALASAVEGLRCDHVDVSNAPVFDARDKTAMVPWHNTRDGLLKAIDELRKFIHSNDEDPFEYTLLLHTGIAGVIIGADEHAFTPDELAHLGFKDVMCGHYHAHKVFYVETPDEVRHRIVSIGAPTHQVWSDVGVGAGFIVVDGDKLDHFPSDAPSFVDFVTADKEAIAGNFVRIRDLELERDDLEKLRDELYKHGAAAVIIHAATKSSVVEREGATTGGVVPSNEVVIDTWVDSAELGDIAGDVKSNSLRILRAAEAME